MRVARQELTGLTGEHYSMASESNSLPPGFQFSEKLVAGRLDFDIVRLEDDERFHRGDRTDGIWKFTD